MIVIGGCQRLTCATRILKSFSHNVRFYKKDDIYIYRKIHTSAAINILSRKNYENEYRKSKQLGFETSLINIQRKNDLPGAICQTSRELSIASKIVDKAPLKIKPYMKLMRIDKPIGNYLMI